MKTVENQDDSSDDEQDEFYSDDDSVLSFDMSDGDDGESADEEEEEGDDENEDEDDEEDSENESNENQSDSSDEQSSNTNEDEKTINNSETNKEPKQSAKESFKNAIKEDTKNKNKTSEPDEYDQHDTSDEEDIRNTVGNIPMHWYDEYKHIGYDWDAKKIIKPAKGDTLDDFLKKMEDPNFWRTVKDPQTGQSIILSDADIDLIKRIHKQRIPDKDFDSYPVRTYFNILKTNLIKYFLIYSSHGLIGFHPKLNKCQYLVFLIVRVRSYHQKMNEKKLVELYIL